MAGNLVISHCCCAEDNKEIHKELQRTCTAIVLLIKPFVWWRFRSRCRRGLRKVPVYPTQACYEIHNYSISYISISHYTHYNYLERFNDSI